MACLAPARVLLLGSKAVSITNVAKSIAIAADKLGIKTDYVIRPHVAWTARKTYDACMAVMAFDPIFAGHWLTFVHSFIGYGGKGLFYATVEGRLKRHLINRALVRTIPVVANSLFTKRMLEEAGVGVKDVVYHAIAEELVLEAEQLRAKADEAWRGVCGDRPRVLFPAACMERKGFETFNKVVEELERRGRDYCVVVVTNEACNLVRRSRLVRVVELFGKMYYTDILAFIGEADVLLFPSWAEGFGLPILEAMWMGTPAIHNEMDPFIEFSPCTINVCVNVVEVREADSGWGQIFLYRIGDYKEYADAVDFIIDAARRRDGWREDVAAKLKARAREFEAMRWYPRLFQLLGVGLESTGGFNYQRRWERGEAGY